MTLYFMEAKCLNSLLISTSSNNPMHIHMNIHSLFDKTAPFSPISLEKVKEIYVEGQQ